MKESSKPLSLKTSINERKPLDIDFAWKTGKGKCCRGLQHATGVSCQEDPRERREEKESFHCRSPCVCKDGIKAFRGSAPAPNPPYFSSVKRGSFHIPFLLQRTPVCTSFKKHLLNWRQLCERQVLLITLSNRTCP